jgi:hypothetical protein
MKLGWVPYVGDVLGWRNFDDALEALHSSNQALKEGTHAHLEE